MVGVGMGVMFILEMVVLVEMWLVDVVIVWFELLELV